MIRRALLLLAFTTTAFAQQTVHDGIPALAGEIGSGILREQKPRVAVLPFAELSGPRTALGTYIAESLTTQLVQGDVDVLERRMLKRALDTLRIDVSGSIDAEAAKAIGRETGVQAIVTGSITDLQSALAVNARVIDASSGRIVTASEVLIARDEMVESMLAQTMGPASAPASSPSNAEPRNLTWNDGAVRITIENSDRRRNAIELRLAFENTSGKALQLAPRRYSLVDEHGDEYRFGYDGAQLMTKGAALAPGKSTRSVFVFACRTGSCDGATFTMKDESGAVVVKNLTAED